MGGTNTDAVLIDGAEVIATTKQPTTADVSSGVANAIGAILSHSRVPHARIASVTIGTTHFTNALVERDRLDQVATLRLASPSGEALPPMTGWPVALQAQIGRRYFLLPGGYEVDGRKIAPLDPAKVRAAARACRDAGVNAIAISSAFAPLNAAMEEDAARIVRDEHPDASLTLSHRIGRLGLIERENSAILNAALTSLAQHVMTSFARALNDLGLNAPLYISQNDGTLISAEIAAQYPVMTIGSGPTNSMRGAAFLTGAANAIVMDVGGTTCDIGVLANGFPRESSLAVDIGGVRTNFRMPDVLAIGLGGGTRIHLDRAKFNAKKITPTDIRVGPDSVGFRLTEESCIFGGATLTASDIAVAAGRAQFGDAARLPKLSAAVIDAAWGAFRALLEDGVDSMKTTAGDATIIAVGGGSFLIDEAMKGAGEILRPQHAAVANAIGAAIAPVGAQIEQIVDYDTVPREEALARLRAEARARVIASGGAPDSVETIDVDEVFLSYLPGRSAQVRVKAAGDLLDQPVLDGADRVARVRHAH